MEITLNVHLHLPPVLLKFLENTPAVLYAKKSSDASADSLPTPVDPAPTSVEAPRKKRGPKPVAEAAPPVPETPPPAESTPTPAPAATGALTPKDLGTVLQETIKLVGLPKASTVFTKFKAGRILDVRPEDYAGFVKYCLDLQEQFRTEALKA